MAKTIIDFEKGDISALKEISDALQTIIDKEGSIAEQWKQVLTAMNNGNATAAASTTKVAQGIEQITSEQKNLAAQVNTTGTVTENQNKSNIASNKKLSESIDEVAQSQKEVAAQTKTTGASLENQNKTSIAGTNKLAQSIDQLSVASKSMDKVVIGGAYKNYLKQIQDQLGLTGKELTNYILNARKAAQAEVLNPSNSKERIDELTLSIQVMNDALKSMGVTEDGTANKTQTLRTQIRAIKDELVAMADAGLEGTPAFIALQNKAGALDDQMNDLNKTVRNLGSDTKNIDGLISVVSGVAGAYSVAQGAAALFGDENEDVAKALIKVQSAMAILQGLQEISNVLQKESSANLFLNNLLRTKNTAAITANAAASTADAGAKTLEAAGTEAATVAQTGLNVAMIASPVGILILSVGTLVGLYQIFSERSKEATEAQQKLNKEIEFAIDLNNEYVTAIGQANDLLLEQAKARGAQAQEIRNIETNSLKEQLAQTLSVEKSKQDAYNKSADYLRASAEGRIKFNSDEVKANQKTVDDFNQIQQKRFDLEHQLEIKSVQNAAEASKQKFKDFQDYQNARIASAIAGTDAERLAEIQAIKEIAKARESDIDFLSKSESEKALIRLNDEKQIQSLELANYQHYLKGRTAAVDAELAIQKAHQSTSDADQIASINKITDLQIASIERQRKEQLANPTLNQKERDKINADANLATVEAEKKKQQDILNVQKASLTLQQAATQKGSYEEYVYNLALIENERQAEIAAAGKNKDLIEAIDAKYRKKKQDAEKEFSEEQLQNEIRRDDTALAKFGITEKEKLGITLKRLDDERAVEISVAQRTASDVAVAVAAINAKYDQQAREAKKASIEAELALNIKALDTFNEIGTRQREAIISNPLSSPVAKQIANDALLRNEQFKSELALDALKHSKLIEGTEEYEIALQAIRNKEEADIKKHSQTAIQIFKDEQDKKLSILQQTISVFQNSLNALDAGGLQTGLQNALNAFDQIAKAVSDYKKALADPDADKAAAKQAEGEAIKTASIIAIQNTLNELFADSAAKRQQELSDHISALEEEKNAELNNANLTAKQKSAINAKYAEKEKQVKLAAWRADQQAKESQIVIEGALNVVKAFPDPVLMALAAGLTFLELGVVATQKPPKFRHGKVDIQPVEYKSYTGRVAIKGPGTKTSDSIPALISAGETVIAADPTAKWKEALTAINNDHFEDYLSRQIKSFVFPHIPDDMPMPSGKTQEIDYKQLAKEVAKEMKGIIPAPKSTHVSIDKSGIHTIVLEGNTRTEWKNKRFSMD